jgi:hypothetical protein
MLFHVARITPHHSRNISEDSYLKCYTYVTLLVSLIHNTCRFPNNRFTTFLCVWQLQNQAFLVFVALRCSALKVVQSSQNVCEIDHRTLQ